MPAPGPVSAHAMTLPSTVAAPAARRRRRPRRSLLARVMAFGPARKARRRLKSLEARAKVLRRIARSRELGPADQAFLVHAIGLQDRVTGTLSREAAVQDLCLSWREGVTATIEKQVARCRHLARQREAASADVLPSTVEAERRRSTIIKAVLRTDDQVQQEREELLQGLEEVAASLDQQ